MKKGKKKRFKKLYTWIIIIGAIFALLRDWETFFSKIVAFCSKIDVVDLQVEDLSAAGMYLSSEESRVMTSDDSIIYKKGAVLHLLVENPKETTETIQDCNLVITNSKILKESSIIFFPVTFDNSISIYALNNGNSDRHSVSTKLKFTFDDIFDDGSRKLNYKIENIITVELRAGEFKEVFQYSFEELDDIFLDRPQWLHILSETEGKETFVGNIAKVDDGYEAFINQGGDSADNPIPVYLKNGAEDVEIKNTFPSIANSSTTVVDFLLLPDESVEVEFYFDITFSNGNKAKSPTRKAQILVPLYDDQMDYNALITYIQKSKIKSLTYDSAVFMDTDCIYDAEELYRDICARDINN